MQRVSLSAQNLVVPDAHSRLALARFRLALPGFQFRQRIVLWKERRHAEAAGVSSLKSMFLSYRTGLHTMDSRVRS